MNNPPKNKNKTEERKVELDKKVEDAEVKNEDQEKIAQLEGQVAELTDRWKRALADYQNLQKRVAEREQGFVQWAVRGFLEKILPVIDDLERAHAHIKDPGLELALKKMQEVLKSAGVERVETMGKPYDIQSMEAIQIVAGEKDNLVITEHRPGYTMHGAILRPAQVTVSKKKE